MMKPKGLWLVALSLGAVVFGVMEYRDRHPASAQLPTWIRGEFAASAERYAGRTVSVDSAKIRFSHGSDGGDVLPIEWIAEVKDARSHVRILDLHVRDGDVPSTIRLIASAHDSSFRLQTMPDVAWRRLSDRDVRAERVAERERRDHDPDTAVSPERGTPPEKFADSSAGPVASDTVIRAQRFADRDPVARDELVQVVAACRRFGCRIGIRGLEASRFAEFSRYLRGLGADSVALTAEPSESTNLAMLEIVPRQSSRR
ncbi:MAG: hypothetical protein H7099_10825 [Gemmatimonadaceae bacterium]|nr:hypothetical protein [Gemmatimonadaceae bacterium]